MRERHLRKLEDKIIIMSSQAAPSTPLHQQPVSELIASQQSSQEIDEDILMDIVNKTVLPASSEARPLLTELDDVFDDVPSMSSTTEFPPLTSWADQVQQDEEMYSSAHSDLNLVENSPPQTPQVNQEESQDATTPTQHGESSRKPYQRISPPPTMAEVPLGDGAMVQVVPVPPTQAPSQVAVSVASASAIPTSGWGSLVAPSIPPIGPTDLDLVVGLHLPAHVTALQYLYARIDQLHVENVRLNRSVSRLTSQLAATRLHFDNEVQSRNRHQQQLTATAVRADIVDQARGQRGTPIQPNQVAQGSQPMRTTRARRA